MNHFEIKEIIYKVVGNQLEGNCNQMADCQQQLDYTRR